MPVWEIIGPVMVGPSSSHTAGAAHIGRIVRMCWGGEIKKAALYMRGSFASTGAGHGTDKALVAGLMGMAQDDPGIRRAFELARDRSFAFVGAHPMAGTENSGFAFARADLFCGAPMVLTPPPVDDISRLTLLDRVNTLLAPLRFGTFSVTTPEAHDAVIAFTSQLAHVVSNAYVKSPTAQVHHGFSAGSYRDLTRVAHLNPSMWAELMCDDAKNLSQEITWLIDALSAYRDALDAGDRDRLRMLLAEGDRIKRSLDDANERAS